ncbi:MAG TPA: GNAT family N-acetyltransferase [Thermoleophilia bacterium]
MGHKVPSLVQLMGAHGEGWRAFVGSAERGESWTAPGVSVGIGGEPSHNLNWIVVYGPDGVAEGIAGAVRELRRRSLPGLLYAASPAAAEAAGAAEALGLVHSGSVPLMCAHAGDVVRAEGDHETRRVDDVEGVLAAGDILGDAFELPVDWCQRLLGVGFAGRTDASVYLSLHDGRPVAAAGVARIGDIAGIYAVGTRHSHRRRGAGATAVSAAIDHELRAGAHWFALLSAPDAEPFYAELGFVTVDHASTWVLPPE